MKVYKVLAREFLSEYACSLRKRLNLSQEEMAESLRITSRAYGDLERGRYCFSASSLLFMFYLLTEEEIMELLKEFGERVSLFEDQEAS
jgi:transcriptional regulator with XRE-family HTH domain